MRQGLKHNFGNALPEAGCDEAGRGCLAGPVFAAAVILPKKPLPELCRSLNDSKKLSLKERLRLRDIITENAVSWGVSSVDNRQIDKTNILKASILAMHRALDHLKTKPGIILVDGNRFTEYRDIPHHCIIRGDATFLSVAAASVLAKTFRDEFMEALHIEFPVYGWDRNKGYPTPLHRRAILEHGLSPYHRLSFRRHLQLSLEIEKKAK